VDPLARLRPQPNPYSTGVQLGPPPGIDDATASVELAWLGGGCYYRLSTLERSAKEIVAEDRSRALRTWRTRRRINSTGRVAPRLSSWRRPTRVNDYRGSSSHLDLAILKCVGGTGVRPFRLVPRELSADAADHGPFANGWITS